MPTPARTPAFVARRSAALTLAAALFMAACSQSPQAAVQQASVAPAAATVVQERGCGASGHPASLQAAEQGLKAQGMALKAQCNAQTGAWVVRVVVVDGVRASKVVRGPLADGHDVDMGTPAGVLSAGAQDFSPDVHHNRRWLRALMAGHQFDNLPDAWWHYAQRGVQVPANDTDLAAR
jgi:D-alanyl-D-alanine dipeptidase